MLVKTETIVLKTMNYRDTSRIVTFYSKEFGKLKGIAKGARTARNKFGSSLEPMTHAMLVMYKKEHQDLHLISQCDAIDSFKFLTEDLDRISAALAVIELVHRVAHDEEHHPALFALLLETLQALNSSKKNYASFHYAFNLRLVSLLGYAPDFEVCGECGNPVTMESGKKRFVFQLDRGAVLCNRCCVPVDLGLMEENTGRPFITISAQALQIMRRMSHAQISSLGSLEFDTPTGNQITEWIRLYLGFHFEGMKPLKSTELFHQHNADIL